MSPRGKFPKFDTSTATMNAHWDIAFAKLVVLAEEERLKAIDELKNPLTYEENLADLKKMLDKDLSSCTLDDYSKNYTIPELVLATEDGWHLVQSMLRNFWKNISDNRADVIEQDTFKYFTHNGYLFEISLGGKIGIPIGSPLDHFTFTKREWLVALRKTASFSSHILFSDAFFRGENAKKINLYLEVDVNVYEYKNVERTQKALNLEFYQLQKHVLNLEPGIPIRDATIGATELLNWDYIRKLRDTHYEYFYSHSNIVESKVVSFELFKNLIYSTPNQQKVA